METEKRLRRDCRVKLLRGEQSTGLFLSFFSLFFYEMVAEGTGSRQRNWVHGVKGCGTELIRIWPQPCGNESGSRFLTAQKYCPNCFPSKE